MHFFSKKVNNKVRMRHLFQVAVLIEKQGVEFYSDLARKTDDEKVRKLCLKLADDEDSHRKKFHDALTRWKRLAAEQEILDSLIRELESKGVFIGELPADISEKELIEYAIEQEKKTAEFYSSFEMSFPDYWKKMHIQQLVITETKHASDLMELL